MQREVRSVPYEGDVLIGRVIEDPVELYPVEGYEDYSYTVVNERRVIVDRRRVRSSRSSSEHGHTLMIEHPAPRAGFFFVLLTVSLPLLRDHVTKRDNGKDAAEMRQPSPFRIS